MKKKGEEEERREGTKARFVDDDNYFALKLKTFLSSFLSRKGEERGEKEKRGKRN